MRILAVLSMAKGYSKFEKCLRKRGTCGMTDSEQLDNHSSRQKHTPDNSFYQTKNSIFNHTHFQVFREETLWPPFHQLEVLDPLIIAAIRFLMLCQTSFHLECVEPLVE
jgi:hypothetical protein